MKHLELISGRFIVIYGRNTKITKRVGVIYTDPMGIKYVVLLDSDGDTKSYYENQFLEYLERTITTFKYIKYV